MAYLEISEGHSYKVVKKFIKKVMMNELLQGCYTFKWTSRELH